MNSPRTNLIKFVVLTLVLVLPSLVFAQKSIPAHGGVWVHDEANVLSASDRSQLEAFLKAERDSTSNQIAVLVIKSLEGDEIDSYTHRVFVEWKLGQAKKDNGVLFVVAIDDRQMRIEPGRGLEGALTDARSTQINRNQVAPFFRQNDYASGIKAGVVAIVQSIQGEYQNDEPVRQRRGKKPTSWVTLLVLLVFIIIASRRGGGGKGGYMSRGGWILPMGGMGGGFGGSSGSWGGGSDMGGGGFSGGGGSSDSW